MVAQAGAAPILESAEPEFLDLPDPRIGQKDVVDVIGGAVLPTVSPIERRPALPALLLAVKFVVGAEQTKACQRRHRKIVIVAPAGFVPNDIVVEVPGRDARPCRNELLVFRERPAQGASLSLARDARARILRPDRLAFHPVGLPTEAKAVGLGAFRDDRDVGLECKQDLDLAIQRHVAVPGDDPHGRSTLPSTCPKEANVSPSGWRSSENRDAVFVRCRSVGRWPPASPPSAPGDPPPGRPASPVAPLRQGCRRFRCLYGRGS